MIQARVPGPAATALQQGQLGAEEEREERRLAVLADMETRLGAVGEITKPKQVLPFVDNVVYKAVGSQQLKANCMFCGQLINSTGATRVVDHFAFDCVLLPRAGQEAVRRYACLDG